jgi:hypothetical protein
VKPLHASRGSPQTPILKNLPFKSAPLILISKKTLVNTYSKYTMSETNINSSQTYDDKQLIEDIAVGQKESPRVDVEADYQASKAYSYGLSAEAAAAVTAPMLEIPEPETPEPIKVEASGDPSQFLAMARDLPTTSHSGNITDELVKKALNIE